MSPPISSLNLDFEIDNEFSKILERGDELLKLHGLSQKGWRFDLFDHRVTLGMCDYEKKKIFFSTYYAHVGQAEIDDTILHEIAHALVGSGAGHGIVWRAKCREIGAKPERLAGEEIKSLAKHKFVLKCSNCGNEQGRRYRLHNSLARYRSSCCRAKLQAFELIYKNATDADK